MPKRPDTKGFNPDEIDYLVGHAQHLHGPTDFDEEVQRHLDSFKDEPNEAESEEGDNKDAIRNISFGESPKIPGAPKPPVAPKMAPPPDA